MLLYQNSIRKCEDNLEHCLFIFCMICNFSKCDGIIIICEQYLSDILVLNLLPLLCNHGNLTLKLHQKK